MNSKQSQICPKCSFLSWMDFIKDNTWLKCRTCGHSEKVIKRIIKVLKK